MTFHAFLTQKYPLYADTEIKVNLTVSQLLELVEEYISETSPVFEVKVVDAENTSYNSVTDFMMWKDSLYSENRGGKMMYDVKGWYKWLEESELLDYFLTRVI